MSIENEKYDIRQRIIDSAKERIIKYGYRNLRIDDITNDLQISKRTLYEIFSSKEDLVRELFQQSHAILANEIESVLSIIINNEEADFLFELRKLWSIVKNHTDTVSNQHWSEVFELYLCLHDIKLRSYSLLEHCSCRFDMIFDIFEARLSD